MDEHWGGGACVEGEIDGVRSGVCFPLSVLLKRVSKILKFIKKTWIE